jgi:5-methyltetrahydrofolate--homocysteine methyltransferase
MADLAPLTTAIAEGDRAAAVSLTQQAIDDGIAPQVTLEAMSAGMADVGRRFACNEIFIPEMLVSAKAMKEATALLEPLIVRDGIRPEHTAVIGTIEGDLHDIGKNLVGMMLRGAGFEVVDLGVNVGADAFIEAARAQEADLVGVSALLTTTMTGMRDVVEAFREADLPDVRLMVGGAPVTAEFAAEIGADGFAPDAARAVDVAKDVLGSPR